MKCVALLLAVALAPSAPVAAATSPPPTCCLMPTPVPFAAIQRRPRPRVVRPKTAAPRRTPKKRGAKGTPTERKNRGVVQRGRSKITSAVRRVKAASKKGIQRIGKGGRRVLSLPRRFKVGGVQRGTVHYGNLRPHRDFAKVAPTRMQRFNAAASLRGRSRYGPPHSGRSVRDLVTKRRLGREFARVYTQGKGGTTGSFLVRHSAIKNLTARQIQAKLQLEHRPTRVQRVAVPAGARLRVGRVAKQPFGQASGKRTFQYELLRGIKDRNFRTGETIKPN